jgi:hypothetical protein
MIAGTGEDENKRYEEEARRDREKKPRQLHLCLHLCFALLCFALP